MFEVVKNLIILILLSVIIWWIAYLIIYPKKVKDNIEKLWSYDLIVSFIFLKSNNETIYFNNSCLRLKTVWSSS